MLQSLDCALHSTREINLWLRKNALENPDATLQLFNPDSRHNLGVGLLCPLKIEIQGPVGYYAFGLCDEIQAEIWGGAGWGLAENLMGGRVHLHGNAGSSAGATMHGGTLIIDGDAGARCAAAMKGGTLIVGGDVGIMTGFMMQKGALIICGDAGPALGDSLYEGRIFLRGVCEEFGSDTKEAEMSQNDRIWLQNELNSAGFAFEASEFRLIESARRLYNFNTKEKEIWKNAL